MNIRHSLQLSLALASLTLSTTLQAQKSTPGVADLGSFKMGQTGECVEVNLQPGMLSIASKIVAEKEPDIAELLREIKQVRVNVVKLDDSNRAQAVEQLTQVRNALTAQGWQPMVTVREKDNKTVDIFVKTRGDEAIEGLVVAVLDNNREAVLVNIVGHIRPENISRIADRMDIEPLRKLQLNKANKVTQATPNPEK